jgi:hypothetical protein
LPLLICLIAPAFLTKLLEFAEEDFLNSSSEQWLLIGWVYLTRGPMAHATEAAACNLAHVDSLGMED